MNIRHGIINGSAIRSLPYCCDNAPFARLLEEIAMLYKETKMTASHDLTKGEFTDTLLEYVMTGKAGMPKCLFWALHDIYKDKEYSDISFEEWEAIKTKYPEYKEKRTIFINSGKALVKKLGYSIPLYNNNPENIEAVTYIDYIEQYEPNTPKFIVYSNLFNLGFMAGLRAERAKRKGRPAPLKTAVNYISINKRRKAQRSRQEHE